MRKMRRSSGSWQTPLRRKSRHHIFPKKRLYDAGYSRSQVNALANFCFLTAKSNWHIGAADPVLYLAEAEERDPGVLKSQWIPEDEALWSIDRYPEFLDTRPRPAG